MKFRLQRQAEMESWQEGFDGGSQPEQQVQGRARRQGGRDRVTRSRLVGLADAVADHVRTGDTVFLGGFGHCVPYGLAHEVLRQEITGLTVVKTGADIVVDELVAAGARGEAVVEATSATPASGWPTRYTRARAAGTLEVEEWTNFSLVLRLEAARLGPAVPADPRAPGRRPAAPRSAPGWPRSPARSPARS